jgi:poly(A) polymerase
MSREERRTLTGVPWLTSGPVARVLAMLNADGEEARVVGGAVRNALLGAPIGEIDLATTALPSEVERRAGAAGLKSVPTGIDHGTVTLIVDGAPFEVTTLREDVETFGRKATVRFGRDWRKDAERRDFTMNALSVSADGTVHDYVGGLADLDARRIRFIGDPEQRIREDYLRILRFFRFFATYAEGAADPAALRASIRMRDGLGILSRERIRTELLKLLVAPRAEAALTLMADAGLLGALLGGVPVVPQFARLAQREAVSGEAPSPVRRLAVLAVHVSEDADRLHDRLRLANAEHERLLSMADGWWRIPPEPGPKAARALLYRLGPERFRDRALFAWTRSEAAIDDSAWRSFFDAALHWTPPPTPFRAADFIAAGLAPGPALGRALTEAERQWIAADFPMDAAALTQIATAAMRAHREDSPPKAASD